jgi:hypothetical protein
LLILIYYFLSPDFATNFYYSIRYVFFVLSYLSKFVMCIRDTNTYCMHRNALLKKDIYTMTQTGKQIHKKKERKKCLGYNMFLKTTILDKYTVEIK